MSVFIGTIWSKAVAIRFEAVRFVVPAKKLQPEGSRGMLPQENVWNLESMKLLLRHIFLAQYDASWRPDDSFTCMDIYSFGPLHRTVLTWFQLSNHSLISQATSFADKACKTNHLLGRMANCWKKTQKSFLHCLQPFCKLQHVTHVLSGPCVGISRATALICDIKEATIE